MERQKKQKAELKKKNAKKNKQKPSSNDTETQTKKEPKKEPKKDDLDFSITPRRKSKLGGNINISKSPIHKPKSPGIKPPKMHKMEKQRSANKKHKKDDNKPKRRLSKLKDNNKMEPLINIKELQMLKEENIDLKKKKN
eukprot:39397_1